MRPNVDRVKQGYEAFAEHDIERVLEHFADDMQWEMPTAEGLPEKGSFYGTDEIAWMLRQMEDAYGDGLRVVPAEYFVDGDTVVVIGDYEGTPNGNRFKVPYCTVWWFADGEVRRAQTIFDTAMVIDALGRAAQ